MTDIATVWEVPYNDAVHTIEFEYEPLAEKRVISVDGVEVRKRIFKMAEKDDFNIGKIKACISVKPSGRLGYEYNLSLNGKPWEKFVEEWKAVSRTWMTFLDGDETRIVLEKDTMDVWVNGEVLETAGEFADNGTETHFSIRGHACYIKAVSSGKKREGIIHTLFVDGQEIPESME